MPTEYTQDDLKLRATSIAEYLYQRYHRTNVTIGKWFLRVHNAGCQLVIPYTLKGETKEQTYTEAL